MDEMSKLNSTRSNTGPWPHSAWCCCHDAPGS